MPRVVPSDHVQLDDGAQNLTGFAYAKMNIPMNPAGTLECDEDPLISRR